MKTIKKTISILTVFMLILSITACTVGDNTVSSNSPSSITESSSSKVATVKKLTLNVDNMGQTYTLNIETSGSTLYDALKENDLIKGNEGPYGFFVSEFNGVKANGGDGTYWIFKDSNGEYFLTGVETTEIKDGDVINVVRSRG